jgi:crotonobetainyl-CoA:carnitine CoA-transferase CaiB-like acyl-CoA transferase
MNMETEEGPAPVGAQERPLSGLLVADFSRVLSGPYASMLLGDLGATVVKVERPGVGDESRAWGPPFIGEDSTYYMSANRNKRGVALDLRDPQDHARARELALSADVLVENFRPGTMDRLGLGYEQLRSDNPRLVYCAISGFGRGAGAQLAGYDFLIQAVGGLMSITGESDGEPTKVGVALVDVIAGLFATIGILAALRERDASGVGQRVDLDLLSSLLAVLVNQASGYLATGRSPQRMGNRHPSVAPYALYATADTPIVLAVGNGRQFDTLCRELGREELADDARFATNAGRIEHGEALRAALEEALQARSADAWISRFQAVGVPCGKVHDLGEAFRFAESLGLSPSVEIADPEGRRVRVASNPLLFSRTPVRYELAPPQLGEHSDALASLLESFRGRTGAPAGRQDIQ